MPELPEVTLYLHALEKRIAGEVLQEVRIRSPSVLKSFYPPIEETVGRRVVSLERLGKRVVVGLGPYGDERDDPTPAPDLFLVFHLMIAGRFQWRKRRAPIPRKMGHAAFDFARGTLLLTEASSHKRASLHVAMGRGGLAEHDRGGIEPLEATLEDFGAALRRRNRTLKRALTDPGILSGIGNAHSDEILWRARLSPAKWTSRLTEQELERLYEATRASLAEWSARLIDETGARFPTKVTAFHPAMAVHGKYDKPCPACGSAVQRIVYATRETNYCPRCQTGGKLLADRAYSRLLRGKWPRTLAELEAMERRGSE